MKQRTVGLFLPIALWGDSGHDLTWGHKYRKFETYVLQLGTDELFILQTLPKFLLDIIMWRDWKLFIVRSSDPTWWLHDSWSNIWQKVADKIDGNPAALFSILEKPQGGGGGKNTPISRTRDRCLYSKSKGTIAKQNLKFSSAIYDFLWSPFSCNPRPDWVWQVTRPDEGGGG